MDPTETLNNLIPDELKIPQPDDPVPELPEPDELDTEDGGEF